MVAMIRTYYTEIDVFWRKHSGEWRVNIPPAPDERYHTTVSVCADNLAKLVPLPSTGWKEVSYMMVGDDHPHYKYLQVSLSYAPFPGSTLIEVCEGYIPNTMLRAVKLRGQLYDVDRGTHCYLTRYLRHRLVKECYVAFSHGALFGGPRTLLPWLGE